MIGGTGFHPYLGGGIVTGLTPASAAVTYSPSDPSPGLNCATQVQYGGAAFQFGYSRKDGYFGEAGFGGPPGVSFTCFDVW